MERITPTPSPVPHTPEQGRDAPPKRDGPLTTLTNYLIVSGLLTCAVIGLVQLGQQLSPTWQAAYVPLLCFGLALESAYMTRYTRYHKLPVPWYVLRGVEVAVVFLMLRSLLGVLRGPQPEQVVNPFYGTPPDGELIALVLIAGLAWLGSWYLASNLLNLEMLDPALDREIIREAAASQVEFRQQLITFLMVIGLTLTFLTGLLRVYLRTNAQAEAAGLNGLGHVVVYFFLSLVLFSRTRLNLLRSGWVWERVPIRQGVGSRWITYTLLLLAIAVVVALVLPTSYSLGLLGTLGMILQLIIAVVQLIIFAIAALLYALLSLLVPNLQQPTRPPPALENWLPLTAAPAANQPGLSEFVQSLIFWIVFLIVAGYVAVQFLRRHPELAEWLKRLPGMSLLARAWHKVREWFGGLNQSIENMREARRTARQFATRSASAPRRWINPRKLSPRQQVQFYYGAMLRRSGEHGHARQPTQTPYEYARSLESQVPDIDQDVDGLTEKFIEARYSRHDIAPEHVSMVRRYWERIKRALRR
jgi:hypothetical protein